MAARHERCYESLYAYVFLFAKGLSNDDVGVAEGTVFPEIRHGAGAKNRRLQ